MTSSDENRTSADSSSLFAFAFVWVIGIASSMITFRWAISGKLWALGVPDWGITLTVLVGIWQWIWILPMLQFARSDNRTALYKGLLRGGISFSGLQLGASFVLYLMLRKLSLQ